MRVLLAERQAPPRAQQFSFGCGHEDRVAGSALIDPSGGHVAVEIANVFRLFDSVAGRFDPDVVTPHGILARGSDEVPNHAAVSKSRGTGRVRRTPDALQLLACGGGLGPAGRQQRLRGPMARVAGCQ
jgi:hypothetical protein